MNFKIIRFQEHGDPRGQLVALEENKEIPFRIKRVYFMYDTLKDVVRGHHAHKSLEQILFCVHGSCRIHLDDGTETAEILLDKPYEGLYIANNLWREMYDFSEDAVLLVLAFTSMSNVFILFIPGFFIFAASGVLNVLTTVFLANTVDYGELKNGRRDESVVFSMQTFVVKLASGVAALIAAACLQIFSLSSDAATEAEQTMDLSTTVAASSKVGLRMTMTILPIIGLIAAFFWFRKRYILTDEKIEEISAQLHK